ncbi:hypothetical protein BHM03_00014084 [Ensete ventricosum]|uniref:Uncharacterized protein n=1 Tax=Ensete ventricosum TaxID=4639 RepID=A0A445ME40_ENSVE|nr:hypothetical protein BHM03_00014084 [Ensete ventricosum]
MCTTKLAADESIGHQHMGAMYHQGRSQIVSTSESHGGDLIIQSLTSQRTRPKLPGGHSGIEAGGRKGRENNDEFSGAQLPKSKASVRNEVDSEEHHSAVEADISIAKEGM